jgi:hypothetical protein
MDDMDATRDTLAWEVELDRLELEVIQIERLLAAVKPLEATEWEPPRLATPLPGHLLPRALEIHERQGKALQQVLRALHTAQRHRRYVDRVTPEDQPVPRYLDITA